MENYETCFNSQKKPNKIKMKKKSKQNKNNNNKRKEKTTFNISSFDLR